MNHQTHRFLPLKTIYLSLIMACAFLLSSCSQPVEEPAATPGATIHLVDCQLSAPGLIIRLPARCGTLKVFEDEEAGAGREIDLNVAVVPAISRSPAPDPLFLFAGGPGQAATDTYVQLSFAFERINQERDIVLVDQRGTGKSNPLNCTQASLPEEGTTDVDPQFKEHLQACLDNLDADPRMYTTPIAARDVDRVRSALGYDQINLYGVSYGTRAVMTYLQTFPNQVRTAILDGVVPQDEPLGLDVARDAQRALDLIFSRCEQDASCSQAFPGVREEFLTLLESLDEEPVEVTLPHPTTGRRTTITFTADELGSAVRLLTYTPETAALLPLLIHQTANQEDFSPLVAQYLMVAENLVESISEGMNYAVICTEDYPFISSEAAAEANQGTYLGDAQIEGLKQICDVWPVGDLPEEFHEPVRSDVPVLLLSGEADPVTPPENAAQVAETLPNSLSLVAAGQGHNIVYRGCIPFVVTDFVESGTTQGLDTSCVQQIKAPPFFIDFTGPTP